VVSLRNVNRVRTSARALVEKSLRLAERGDDRGERAAVALHAGAQTLDLADLRADQTEPFARQATGEDGHHDADRDPVRQAKGAEHGHHNEGLILAPCQSRRPLEVKDRSGARAPSGSPEATGLPGANVECSWVSRIRPKISEVTALTALILRMPLGLVVIYVVAAVLWYELFRSAVLRRIARRRNSGRDTSAGTWKEAELAESEREAAEQEAAEASEPDYARRLYYLARKAARAERDLAIQTANEATEKAVERIEVRYREIATDLDDEEAERLSDRPERTRAGGLSATTDRTSRQQNVGE
jgi:hypothetical protein